MKRYNRGAALQKRSHLPDIPELAELHRQRRVYYPKSMHGIRGDEPDGFMKLFDGLSECVLLIDMEKEKIAGCNDMACSVTGYTREEFCGLRLCDMHNPESYTSVMESYAKQLAKDAPAHSELQLRRKEGTYFYADLSAVKAEIGARRYLLAFYRDATPRKEVVSALQESEERFMNMIYASPDAILLLDGETFVECNDAAVKMLGYGNRTEFLLSHPSRLSPPVQPDGKSSFDKANQMIRIALEKGFHRFEWMHRKANGEDFPVEVSLTPVIWNGKNILHCLWRDITDKKRMENNLVRTRALLINIINSTKDLIFAKDTDFRIILCNKAYANSIGKTPEEMLGHDDIENGWPHGLVNGNPDKGLSGFRNEDIQVLKGELFHNPHDPVEIAGETKILDTMKMPLYDEKGKIFGLMGIARDTTEYRNAQNERMNLEKQLYQAQKLDALGELAAGITHDLNNMLSALMGYALLLSEGKGNEEERKKYIQNILKLGDKGKAIVSQVLSFARPAEVNTFKVFNIMPLIEDTLKMISSSIKYIATVSFESKVKNPPMILGVSVQIQQLLLNLFTNAMDAMEGKRGGRLEVTIDEYFCKKQSASLGLTAGHYLKLSVKDTGAGMSPEVRKKIFQPFFSTKAGKGTGLGLSIVSRVVKNHYGAIEVESKLDEGTSIVVYLPAASSSSCL